MAVLCAILNSQLENFLPGSYVPSLPNALTKASWARSSASVRSRTIRRMRVYTGRS